MPPGSRLVAGSSSSTSDGSWRKVRASRSRCRWPCREPVGTSRRKRLEPERIRGSARRRPAGAIVERTRSRPRTRDGHAPSSVRRGHSARPAGIRCAAGIRRRADRETRHRHSARVRQDQPGDDSEERRLPTPLAPTSVTRSRGEMSRSIESRTVPGPSRQLFETPRSTSSADSAARRSGDCAPRQVAIRWVATFDSLTGSPAQPGARSPDKHEDSEPQALIRQNPVGRLVPRSHTELSVRGRQMALDGRLGHVELARDLDVREAEDDHRQDLLLAR